MTFGRFSRVLIELTTRYRNTAGGVLHSNGPSEFDSRVLRRGEGNCQLHEPRAAVYDSAIQNPENSGNTRTPCLKELWRHFHQNQIFTILAEAKHWLCHYDVSAHATLMSMPRTSRDLISTTITMLSKPRTNSHHVCTRV